MKKGQAAMEFLLTYGWAILAALVVIGALAYFGVLNPQRLVPTRCDIPGNIKCVDKLIDQANARVQLRLQNAVGNTIRLDSISSRAFEAGIMECTGATTCNGVAVSGGTVQVLAGDAINCLIPCGTFSTSLKKGARVRANITLGYTDLSTTFAHTVVGELISDVE
jgi:hypothetical protein